MKLGLVLECDMGGPDELVLICLARRLNPAATILPVALGSKEQVFLRGVDVARELVEVSACDRVLIVWDLKPYWQKAATRTCEAEADELRQKIATTKSSTAANISLLCLTWELETWLIADSRAVNKHLSTGPHVPMFHCSKPLSKTDPKAYLDRECKKYRGRYQRYVDVREAIQIARHIPDTKRISRVPSFARFAGFVCGNRKAAFKQCGDVCNDLVHQAYKMGKG